jgi:hypothetical protein
MEQKMEKGLTEHEKHWLLAYKGTSIHSKQARWVRDNRPEVSIDCFGRLCGISYEDYRMMPWEFLRLCEVSFYTKEELFAYFGVKAENLTAVGKFKPYFWVAVSEDGRLEDYSPVLLLKD